MIPTVSWQGQDRRVVRRAREGDDDYNPEIEQVVIKMGDGSEIVVPVEGDGSGSGSIEPPRAPTVVDAPYVSQNAGTSTMNCTKGNWIGIPNAYSYQWHKDGTNVGTDSANYPIVPGDVGSSMTCTVTASNALGSASSTSNSVVAS